jgi:hypothetical protein
MVLAVCAALIEIGLADGLPRMRTRWALRDTSYSCGVQFRIGRERRALNGETERDWERAADAGAVGPALNMIHDGAMWTAAEAGKLDVSNRAYNGIIVDGWNRALIFRFPGPVHRHGWDLYSVGPNGIDEQGGGDDILIGEDVAAVTSR